MKQFFMETASWRVIAVRIGLSRESHAKIMEKVARGLGLVDQWMKK